MDVILSFLILFAEPHGRTMTTQSTGLTSTATPSMQHQVVLSPSVVEFSSISSVGPELEVPSQTQNPIFTSNPGELQSSAPHILAQPSAAPHHVPYLLNQAQQQFALMEQQYEQHVQQEQHQKEQTNQLTVHHFAMDMCDSDSSSQLFQPEDSQLNCNNEPSASNELIDLSTEESNFTRSVDSSCLENSPAIPISHLLAGNSYPSLTKPVPIGIAQSFAPVFVQPQLPAQQQGGDIYNDYVQNPYNLVLQSSDQQHVQPTPEPHNHPVIPTTSESTATPTTTTSTEPPIANVFQSANYFGSDQTARIPPGSEMLFSSP